MQTKWNSKYMLNLGYLSKYRQELYGLSIISIIVFHYFETLIDSGIDGFPYYFSKGYVYIFGSIGVDIFLFLSGIGIYQSCKHNEKKLKKYYQHRFSKVIIPYTIIGLLFWVIKDVFVIEKAELLVEDFFLISFWTKGVRTLWYVALITVLYLISPLLYVIFSKLRKYKWTIVLLVISLLVLVYIEYPLFFQHSEIALLRIPVYILGFASSDDVISYKKIKTIELIPLLLFIPIYLLCYIFNSPFSRLGDGLFSILLAIVVSNILKDIKSQKFLNMLRWVGNISFELYLVHVMGRNILNTIDFNLDNIFVYFSFIIICVPISIIINRLFSHLN